MPYILLLLTILIFGCKEDNLDKLNNQEMYLKDNIFLEDNHSNHFNSIAMFEFIDTDTKIDGFNLKDCILVSSYDIQNSSLNFHPKMLSCNNHKKYLKSTILLNQVNKIDFTKLEEEANHTIEIESGLKVKIIDIQ
jgi:hypothetical protein